MRCQSNTKHTCAYPAPASPLLLPSDHMQKDYKPRELVYTSVAAKAVLGGLSLWKGLERSSYNRTGSTSSAGWRRETAAKEDKRLGPSDKSQPSFLPIDLFGFE